MRRFRGNSRALSEIVGTLILILIVVAAATALSVFVTGYEKTVLSQEANSHEKSLESYTIFGVNVPETADSSHTVSGTAIFDTSAKDTGADYITPSFTVITSTAPSGTLSGLTYGPPDWQYNTTPYTVSVPFAFQYASTAPGTLTVTSVTFSYTDMAGTTAAYVATSGLTNNVFAAVNPLGYYVFDVASTTVEPSEISSITINDQPVLLYCALPPNSIVTMNSICSGHGSSSLGGTWVPLGNTTHFAALQEYEILVNYDYDGAGLLDQGCNAFNTSIGSSAYCNTASVPWPSIIPTGALQIEFFTVYDNTFTQVLRAPIAIASLTTLDLPDSEGGPIQVVDGAASIQPGSNDSILGWYWYVSNITAGASLPSGVLVGEEVPFPPSTWMPTASAEYLITLTVVDGTGLYDNNTIEWTAPP